jgi:uncharacterized phage infection (PIP) family protein YhgE
MEARKFLKGLGLVCVFGLIAMAGCSKSAPPKPVALPPDLLQFKTDTEKARASTDATMGKLDALIATKAGDLAPPYKAFTEAVAKLDTDLKAVLNRADDMKAKGTSYFEAWEKQVASITTPEVKELADKRKADLSTKYTALQEALAKARETSTAVFGNLKDIEKILGNDLNAEGLKSIAPMVQKVKDARKPIMENVDAILARIGDISAVYSRP